MTIGVVNMTGLNAQTREPAGPLEPGDICRSRRGDLYLIVTLPPDQPETGRSPLYMYYFRLDRYGQVIRTGQIMTSYAEDNWTRIGHMDISFGEPEWFV